jgi:hypothetical protein
VPTNPKALVEFTNLTPFDIESDAVAQLRNDMFGKRYGPLPGTIQAKAVGTANLANKYRTGPLPIVQVDSTSGTRQGAAQLAQATVQAYERWLREDQVRDHIPRVQRYFFTQLKVPTPAEAKAKGGTSASLGLVVGLVTFAAFVVLAFVLDAAFPRPQPPYEDALRDSDYDDLDDLAGYDGDAEPEVAEPRRGFAFQSTARRQRAADDDLKAS